MESTRPSSIRRIVPVLLAVLVALAASATLCVGQAHAKTTAPAKAKIASVKSAEAGSATVKVKKAKGAKGYQYKVSQKKSFKGKTTKTKKSKKRSATFKGLKAGKRYYVKARAYSKSGKKTLWGKWSKVKSVKVKAKASGADGFGSGSGGQGSAGNGSDSGGAGGASGGSVGDGSTSAGGSAANGSTDAGGSAANGSSGASGSEKSGSPSGTDSGQSPSESSGSADQQSADPDVYITVSFNVGEGLQIDPQHVLEGQCAIEPPTPTRDGYVFDGWFTSEVYSERFDFDEPIYTDTVVYANWRKVTANYFELSANRSTSVIDPDSYGDEEEGVVTFFANTDLQVDSLSIVDTDTQEELGWLYDNGSYGNNGVLDDMKGDGIYTGAINFNGQPEGARRLKASWGSTASNDVEINVVKAFTNEELESMANVDNSVNSMLEDTDYLNAGTEGRKEKVSQLLDEHVEEGDIANGSVVYNEGSELFSFEYSDGVLGGVSLKDYDELGLNSGISGASGDKESLVVANSKEGLLGDARADDGSASKAAASQLSVESSDDFNWCGSALVLNAFPAFETTSNGIDFRTQFYRDTASEWTDKGISVELKDSDVTVDDFKQFGRYDVVSISTHGGTYPLISDTPAICLSQPASEYQDKKYSAELKDRELVKVNGSYWILPSFFSAQYSSAELSDTFVFSESCEFLGRNNAFDTRMADTIRDRGAKGVVGFHNSVYAEYSREFMKTYCDYLFDGRTSRDSFDGAREMWGKDHKEWYETRTEKTFFEQIFGKHYPSDVAIATPYLYGEPNATMITSGLSNGDFEETIVSGAARLIKSWSDVGDVRSTTKLGNVLPKTGNRMAIITTGVGSSTTAVLGEGTEGSMLSQSFVLPSGSKSLSFDYNFISEEPMEYVGSQYDDSFNVQVFHNGSTAYSNQLESINASTWYPIGNVDFSGGDDTVYQTGWKSAKIDVSAYAGKQLTLRFIVYDMGDSVYDSACLIDNVSIQ